MHAAAALAIAGALLLAAYDAAAQGAQPAATTPTADAVTNTLRALVPAGVTVKELRQEGDKFVFSGNSSTNAQLSNYMRTVDATPGFADIELREIAMETSQYRYIMSIEVDCGEPEATRPGAVCGPAAKKQSVYKCRINGTVTFQAQPCPAGSEAG